MYVFQCISCCACQIVGGGSRLGTFEIDTGPRYYLRSPTACFLFEVWMFDKKFGICLTFSNSMEFR